MLNLIGSSDVALLSGMANLNASREIPQWILVGLLVVWTVAPIVAACLLFQRRSL